MRIGFHLFSRPTQDRISTLRTQAEALKAKNKSMLVQRMLADVLRDLDTLPGIIREMDFVRWLDVHERDVRVIQDACDRLGSKVQIPVTE